MKTTYKLCIPNQNTDMPRPSSDSEADS